MFVFVNSISMPCFGLKCCSLGSLDTEETLADLCAALASSQQSLDPRLAAWAPFGLRLFRQYAAPN